MKRLFDLLGAFIALFLLALPLLALALLVRHKLGGPVLFRQVRPGLQGRPFTMIKFRTMTDEKDDVGNLLPDEKRLTGFGSFLRSSSLDELPELWNVFIGEMSWVGPRPILMEYLPRYSDEQSKRHDVLPGITGWAQVNGRNAISWDEKFSLDVWYVNNANMLLDIKILLLTVKKVLIKEGISEVGSASMTPFQGQSSRSSIIGDNKSHDR